jgi:flagellar biosynthesis anti-sigma factor FlgM
MKVEGDRPNPEIAAARSHKAEKTATEAARQAPVSKPDKGDSVAVSSDAALASSAVKAANESPDIRPDVVERMKQLRDRGELGKDVGKLSDSLIDAMLGKK